MKEMTNTIWVCIKDTDNKKTPKWKRAACITDKGVVFAPAALFGNEFALLLMAGFDDISVIYNQNHLYLPTSWLEKEVPEGKGLCESINRCLKNATS